MRQLKTYFAGLGLFAVVAVAQTGAIAQQIIPLSSTLSHSNDGLIRTETHVDVSTRAVQHPSQVIVRFKTGAPSFLPGSGRSVELSRERNTHVVVNPPGQSVRDVIARYKQNPNVVFAEPDFIVQAIATPNDPMLSQQWDLTKISAQSAWDAKTNSSDVVVAIVDTGIDFTHADLVANLYSEVGNSAVHGYTCIGGSCVAGGTDDYGHGTHVAGTIGAVGNNLSGIAGLNWSTKLLSIKFLNSSGSGAISDAVLGFQKILALKNAGINIRVTNNSWGGGGYSQALKDAMTAVETAGILNVCAAGNSGVNADTSPMYPGAYDNRGIVSVLATDSNDLAAYFTNYGVTSVDIAAPGVSTLSTVPTGTCALCDGTGYKTLSGTSMASPHVAGVAAAMISANPTLTPFEARDAILDPSSYDALSDANARRTSSGGRLNFSKVLTNAPRFPGRVLNKFPTVSIGPDAFVAPGANVSFSQTSSDLDGDTLRALVGRGPVSNWTAWLFGWRENQLFPASVPFTAPNVSTVAAMPYDTSVSDNRGGGATGRNWAVVTPNAPAGAAPTLSLNVPATGIVGTPVTIGVTATAGTAWDINASGAGGSSGVCCYSGSSVSLTFNTAGIYRITSQAIDPLLSTSTMASGLINIGSGAGVPPIAAITLDKKSGTVPLSVGVSAAGSSDSDGTISNYFFDCGVGYATGQTSTTSTCNFTEPGTYWVRVLVTDNNNMMGVAADYVVVTPVAPGADVIAPTLSLLTPAANAVLSAPVTLQVSASDNVGVTEVDYYWDSNLLSAVKTGGLFDYVLDPSLQASGSHIVSAIAKDSAGNSSTKASVSVSIPLPVYPRVTLSPSGTTSAQRNKTKTFTATLANTPTYGLAKLVFNVSPSTGVKLPSKTDDISPYTFDFSSSSAGTYSLTATPYDSKNNAGTPVTLTINVK